MQIRHSGQFGLTRIDNDQLGSLEDSLLHLISDNRVSFSCVGADDKNEIGSEYFVDGV